MRCVSGWIGVLALAVLGCDGGASTPPALTSASLTGIVDRRGATLAGDGITLTVPAGAVDRPVVLSIVPTTLAGPPGYTLYTPVYHASPEGITFARPLSLTLRLTGSDPRVGLYWTRADGSWEARGGELSGDTITATVTHFSEGFVGAPTVGDASFDGGGADLPSSDGPGDVRAGDAGMDASLRDLTADDATPTDTTPADAAPFDASSLDGARDGAPPDHGPGEVCGARDGGARDVTFTDVVTALPTGPRGMGDTRTCLPRAPDVGTCDVLYGIFGRCGCDGDCGSLSFRCLRPYCTASGSCTQPGLAGSACTRDTECLGWRCNGGRCQTLYPGDACQSYTVHPGAIALPPIVRNDCASTRCGVVRGTAGTCLCSLTGGSCRSSDDCCRGACAAGRCACGGRGASCSTDTDCCATACIAGRCSCAGGGIASVTLPAGCSDCCSGRCSGLTDPFPADTCSGGSLDCQCDADCGGDGRCRGGRCCTIASLAGSARAGVPCCSGIVHEPSGSCVCRNAREPCSSDDQCCYGRRCVGGICACSPPGAACASPLECCSTSCTSGRCDCARNGSSCAGGADCCSGTCAAGTCACTPAGGACTWPDGCCSGACAAGRCACAAIGDLCSSGALCCSGSCIGSRCACLSRGATCTSSADCCSGSCASGTCACAPAGSACSTATDCCSGACAGGRCACASAGAVCASDALCCSGRCGGGRCA